ncbi:MAG TPA: hypothetical protein VHX38_02565 [Pseudonocardiaceae bacterium]|jgi:hypothetical protein|nr:hypothetical protein [Pseudonocardiaceae bacterium]
MTSATSTAALGSYHHYLHGPAEDDTVELVTVEHAARGHLGEGASVEQVTALAEGYRRAINRVLDGTGIVLHGDDFYLHIYADALEVEQANELVRRTLDAIQIAKVEPAVDQPPAPPVVTVEVTRELADGTR